MSITSVAAIGTYAVHPTRHADVCNTERDVHPVGATLFDDRRDDIGIISTHQRLSDNTKLFHCLWFQFR